MEYSLMAVSTMGYFSYLQQYLLGNTSNFTEISIIVQFTLTTAISEIEHFASLHNIYYGTLNTQYSNIYYGTLCILTVISIMEHFILSTTISIKTHFAPMQQYPPWNSSHYYGNIYYGTLDTPRAISTIGYLRLQWQHAP